MIRHPQVAKKAQAEIDSVVGYKSLPTFADRPNPPYLEAVIQEILRWEPAAPLRMSCYTTHFRTIDGSPALPHTTLTADEYRGYQIPEGAVIFGNTW